GGSLKGELLVSKVPATGLTKTQLSKLIADFGAERGAARIGLTPLDRRSVSVGTVSVGHDQRGQFAGRLEDVSATLLLEQEHRGTVRREDGPPTAGRPLPDPARRVAGTA